MEIALIVFVVLLGAGLYWAIWRGARKALDRAGEWAEEEPGPRLEKFTGEEPVGPEGLVYLFSHQFVDPAPRRPMGSIPRDRAYACLEDKELCPEDFARQMLYALLTELTAQGTVETLMVARSATLMPPYPQKQWEMHFRQAGPFPGSALAESLAAGFELSRRQRQRSKKQADLAPEDAFFSLEELLEKSLKAIRQEMSFFQRGTTCSDLRRHVEEALIAQGFLSLPERDTWLDKMRTARPTPDTAAIAALEAEAAALAARLREFRLAHGSEAAIEPYNDEQGKKVDMDPDLAKATTDLDTLALDDCLRMTIHEAIASLKQLEPSGEAGI